MFEGIEFRAAEGEIFAMIRRKPCGHSRYNEGMEKSGYVQFLMKVNHQNRKISKNLPLGEEPQQY